MSVAPGFLNVGPQHGLIVKNQVTGATIALDGRRVRFSQKANDQVERSTAISEGGAVDHAVIPGDYQGTIECERSDDAFSALSVFITQQKLQGGAEVFFTITSYEPAADKSAMRVYQYTYVVFHNFDRGTWERSLVKPVINWEAKYLQKLQ